MYFEFTLFNTATLVVMLLTVGMIWVRLRVSYERTWPLGYYVVILAYWLGLWNSLSAPWAIGGIACGVLLRFEFLGGFMLKAVRGLEMVFFGYVLVRGASLLMRLTW
jgi:hypothetical protein